MIKIGLTGGIASGKSTISKVLKERNIPVIDADLISRDVLILYPEINKEIKNHFGEIFYDEMGQLKRKELGDFIFSNPEKRLELEKILIPRIIKEIFRQFDEYNSNGFQVCVLDAPTLIEQNLHKEMDYNILVWVDRATQIERLIRRNKIDHKQAMDRIASQMDLDKKREYADFIIDNSGNREMAKGQLDKVLERISHIIGEESKDGEKKEKGQKENR